MLGLLSNTFLKTVGKNHKNQTSPLCVIAMNRKLTIALTLSLFAVLCLDIAGQGWGQLRVPGVQGGDVFNYNITSHWSSENASEPVPSWVSDWNQTTNYEVRISTVQGVNVTATNVWTFRNGTETPFLIIMDLESGQPYFMSGNQPPFQGIVGSNLNVGELLHPSGNDSVTINQTVTRTYASGVRDTNLVDLTGPVQNQTTDPITNETTYVTIGNQEVKFFIDKATGVLVEQDTTIESLTPHEVATVTWTLKETNVWTVGNSSSSFLSQPVIIAIVAVAAVIVVVAAVVFVFRRRGRRRRHR